MFCCLSVELEKSIFWFNFLTLTNFSIKLATAIVSYDLCFGNLLVLSEQEPVKGDTKQKTTEYSAGRKIEEMELILIIKRQLPFLWCSKGLYAQ